MNICHTITIPGKALSTKRTRTGEPQLYNENIKALLDNLINLTQPNTILLSKLYKDGRQQDAWIKIDPELNITCNGDLPLPYTKDHPFSTANLAADLSIDRSKTQLVEITLYQSIES